VVCSLVWNKATFALLLIADHASLLGICRGICYGICMWSMLFFPLGSPTHGRVVVEACLAC
jgi:hypothetical protein